MSALLKEEIQASDLKNVWYTSKSNTFFYIIYYTKYIFIYKHLNCMYQNIFYLSKCIDSTILLNLMKKKC